MVAEGEASSEVSGAPANIQVEASPWKMGDLGSSLAPVPPSHLSRGFASWLASDLKDSRPGLPCSTAAGVGIFVL